MKFDFMDVETAFEYVSSSPMFVSWAVLCKKTGTILYDNQVEKTGDFIYGETGDDDCEHIPHKNELGLGRDLAFRFVQDYLPDEMDRVEFFFTKKGAYARFKSLLDSQDLLERWYEFEYEEQARALKAWCRENGVELER